MKNRGRLRVIVGLLLCLASATTALAKDNPTYTQWGRDITVGPDDETGELTCIACTVRIRGQVAGDVTTVGGSIVIEDHGQVAGEVTSVAGNVRLDSAAKVSGDVTVVGGTLHRGPEANIGGNVTSVGGQGWIGVRLDHDVDWAELAELCQDAYRAVAPARLAALLGH